MIFFQPTPQGPDLVRVHWTRDYLCREGNKIIQGVYAVVFRTCYGDILSDLFVIAEEWCTFANPNLKIMEDYIKKAADAFLVERPYGMRVDYRKGGYVLFNRNLNVLGNKEHARLEELPLEDFDVDEIPLEGEIIKEHAGFTTCFSIRIVPTPMQGMCWI